ncbi:MAG: cadherin-like domain-containing protein [Asticcacaulis sp.]
MAPIDGQSSLTVSTAELTQGYAEGNGNGYALNVSDLQAQYGTVTDNHDGTFTITPVDGFVGPAGL